MFWKNLQMRRLLMVSALGSFRIAGASWVALLAARGFTLVEIGVAESCFHAASLVFEVPSGAVADVFGRRPTLVLSQCMFIVSAVCMLLLRSMPGICLAMMMEALAYNLASGTREALAYESLLADGHEDAYVHYTSLEMAIYRLDNAAAMLCVGAALWMGYRRAYAVDVVLGVCTMLICLRLKEYGHGTKRISKNVFADLGLCIKESMRFVYSNRHVMGLMLFNAAVGAVATLLRFFLQAKLTAKGLPAALLGPTLFAMSLGGAIGARLASVIQQGSGAKIACMLGVGMGMILGLCGYPVGMCLGGFAAAVCDDLLQVHVDAQLNEQFPSEQRATLISVSSLCFSLVMIALSPLFGWIFSLS
ncbi:MAG: MFS transporter [Clostridia bacterium]|nr:MFS transporter [Clostridia bacterium]